MYMGSEERLRRELEFYQPAQQAALNRGLEEEALAPGSNTWALGPRVRQAAVRCC